MAIEAEAVARVVAVEAVAVAPGVVPPVVVVEAARAVAAARAEE